MPFGEEEEDPYTVYELILTAPIRYPPYVKKPFQAQGIIEQLINRNPAARAGGSTTQIKQHSWFSGIDWNEILLRKVSTPYVPTS